MLMEQLDEYFALMNQRLMQQNTQLTARVSQLEQQMTTLTETYAQQQLHLLSELAEMKRAMK
ncbi:hypothetical protein VST7929_01467 [Vibrio stylophorae]|uniref:Uncharacterized protein n=1 Tax=Vibrio stylophorae TaxID=659351 RepID=A0ABM8ZTE8_9VIBR|nr:hypothetical protein [Vibrio stylophorae]CAH0533597.1 hypothetical protein VST7929_01467 [Vibrio stylophorae]